MRSPAEHYIRYRLIKNPGASADDVARELQAELVFGPGKGYFQKLREEMVVPKSFHPDRLTDHVSQSFLKRHGVWTMWHPHRGTREALSVFKSPRQRVLLQTLVSGPQPDPVIIDIFIRKAKVGLSDDGLDEFRHYFWNVRLLSTAELTEYVSAFMPAEHGLRQIIKAPSNVLGNVYAGVRVGILPNFVDDVEMLDMYQRVLAASFTELSVEHRSGLDRETALATNVSSLEKVIALSEGIKLRRRDDLDDLIEYRVAERKFENPDLRSIGQGAIPFPVSLLMAHPADKEAEGGKE